MTSETPSSPPRPIGNFATTQWSVVVRAIGDHDSQAAETALSDLCQQYWYPLYCYVRTRVSDADDAADIVQGFFLQLLEKSSLRIADQSRGRFRNFLLGSINNFLLNQRRRSRAEKRGGGRKPLSFDFVQADQRFQLEPVDRLTPERVFERTWALELIDGCLMKLRTRYDSQNQIELFESLCGSLLGGDVSYAAIGESLQMNENAIKVAAHRMRQRLRELVRGEVADTVDDPGDVESELQALMRAIQS